MRPAYLCETAIGLQEISGLARPYVVLCCVPAGPFFTVLLVPRQGVRGVLRIWGCARHLGQVVRDGVWSVVPAWFGCINNQIQAPHVSEQPLFVTATLTPQKR